MEKKEEKCGFCGKGLTFWNKQYIKHQGKMICSSCSWKNVGKEFKEVKNKPKQIKETKASCQACGHTWFYGRQDVFDNASDTMGNCGKAMCCCSGCLPAVFIPDKKVTDLNKCPKCGSRAIKKETVIHDV